MTLALLLTAVTGAWADGKVYDSSVNISTLQVGDILIEGAQITISNQTHKLEFMNGRYFINDATTPTKSNFLCDQTATVGANGLMTGLNYGATARPADAEGKEGNAWEVTAVTANSTQIVGITYAPNAIDVTPGSSANTWTFDMPGSDVVLTPIYAKAAAFATTGTEPEVKTLLPEAAEGVIAGTDASLIADGTGIVAFAAASTEATQGTLMYAVGTSDTEAPALDAFSATVPTAKNVADDGATVYVWYYIKGADAPTNVAATLDNTFDDTEPACLTVTVLTNKFDITFNPANANTIEAGKATVTVDGAPATVTDGKLKGVKMGSEVKLEATPGYKFRKVEVKKGAALKTLTVNSKQLNYAEGDTWQQAIDRPENAGSGWSVQGNHIFNGGYTLFINDVAISVYVSPGDTIDATKNYSLEAD